MYEELRMPVPEGNSHPQQVTDWTRKISECSKHDDEDVFRQQLEEYRDAGYPNFFPRRYLSTIENLEDVPQKTQEWSQRRAILLLGYLDRPRQQEMLYKAIENIRTEHGEPSQSPDEDRTMYFVVFHLIHADPELLFELHSNRPPAFVLVASQGMKSIVISAIQELTGLLEGRYPKSADDCREQLFRKLSVSDDSANTALVVAVQENHKDIVQVLLKVDERLCNPMSLQNDYIKNAIKKGQIEIMTMILQAQPTLAERLPKLIVKDEGKNYEIMWKAMVPWFEKYLPGSDILHLAVQNGKLEIIDWLVPRFPEMVIQRDENDKIALWYNIDEERKKKVRASIVPEIVRLCNPGQMKELLCIANDSPRQASLDLRVFNKETHDFTHFVRLVKSKIDESSESKSESESKSKSESESEAIPDPVSPIEFESVLRYVHFPDLSQVLISEDPKTEREEVLIILSWLRQRGVKKILKLVVPDCRTSPLDEDNIRLSLEGFVIEELNWRRLDLGIEPVASLAPALGVLHLYSSGIWAVLSHWVGEEGLKRLEKLRELHIIIVQECMTSDQTRQCQKRTQEHFEDLRSKCGWEWKPAVTVEKWSQGTTMMQETEHLIDAKDIEQKSASSDIRLDEFVRNYYNIQQAPFEIDTSSKAPPLRRIKIALIDTGIGALGFLDQSQIKSGISFGHGVDRESEIPWWIPSNEYGPQMADIITSIDPYCELYPIKITDDTDGAVKARPVIDAIKWAVAQHVDIISLSLVLFNNPEGLHDAVLAASQANIVIICSTADRGNNQQKVYPAQYLKEKKTDCLIPIAGCDQYGKLTDWSTETEAKYHFLGKDVTARCDGLMTKSGKYISGSSVATAIAAGTASLVLACSLIASTQEKYSRKQQIEIYFEKMQTEENRTHQLKYVEPAIIFGKERIAGWNVETYVKQTFGQNR